LKAVLDTCILKLASLPNPNNPAALSALAIDADYLVTVNTTRGHFDQPAYGRSRVVTPGTFVNLPAVQPILRKL
jgi:hypothetical protein